MDFLSKDEIQKLNFIWEVNNNNNNLFYELSTNIDNSLLELQNIKSLNLDLDVSIEFRKCAINDIINYLLTLIENKIENKISKQTLKIIIYIVLISIYPKSRLRFFNNNEFREIFDLFKEEYGDQYILESDIKKISNGKSILEVLIGKKLIEKIDDKYFIKDYYFNNLHFF